MLSTTCQVNVGHVASVHAFLDGEIKHRLLISVFNTGNAGLVALLVVELHILDDADRQVLQGCLHIAQHEFLAVEQYLLHLFAIDGDISIFVNLGSWHSLDQFLNR